MDYRKWFDRSWKGFERFINGAAGAMSAVIIYYAPKITDFIWESTAGYRSPGSTPACCLSAPFVFIFLLSMKPVVSELMRRYAEMRMRVYTRRDALEAEPDMFKRYDELLKRYSALSRLQ